MHIYSERVSQSIEHKEFKVSKVELRAGIAGTIVEVLCEQGSQVQEGDVLVLMESMKMELPEVASCTGRVVKLFVVKGDVVPLDHVIAVIECT
jgi:acetyl-CoA carboxylase biotin carboxyl carrier protein